jgi:hypothetical protein
MLMNGEQARIWQEMISDLFQGTSPESGGLDSTVGIATGYGLDGRGIGVRVPVGTIFFSSPRRPDRFWGPSSLLSNGYRGLFLRA